MAALHDFFDGMHGVIFPFGGTAAPNGFLMCDGAAVSRTTYAALFAAIGTAFGVGDGSTTFNVPDLRGRVIAGVDNMGGASANRLTGQAGGINGDNLGAAGGAETHTLTDAQLPAHTFMLSGSGSGIDSEAAGDTLTTLMTGGQAHNNVQPTMILNYIIKT